MTENLKNIYWINNLKAIAIIAVIIIHISYSAFYNFGSIPLFNWIFATFFDSISRFSVPVLLMITGALLLKRDELILQFFKKRLSRILFPLLFWSVIYFLWFQIDFINNHNLLQIIKNFIITIKNGVYYHFWYLYLLVGIYFTIPVLSKWVLNSNKKEIEFFLIFWIILQISFYPYLGFIRNTFEFTYFTGFIGYPVLGYYLSIYWQMNFKNRMAIILLLIFSGVILTFGNTVIATFYSKKINELYFSYNTFNVLIYSVGMFLFGMVFLQNKIYIFEFISRYSLGIYLLHVLILDILNKFKINVYLVHPIIGVLITTVICLILTSLILIFLSRFSFLKRIIN